MAKRRTPPAPPTAAQGDRITYRELRNTPGRVWERLAGGQPTTLVADGEAKALLIPVTDGDVEAAWDAYTRGRAMLALARIRRRAREAGKAKMSLADINNVIAEVRSERAKTAKRR